MMKIFAFDSVSDDLAVLKSIVYDAFPEAQLVIDLSGKKILELCLAGYPDIILLDMDSPETDPIKLLTGIRKNPTLQHIPVVMLETQKTDPKLRKSALLAGADGFLMKPLDETLVVSQIRAMSRIRAIYDLRLNEMKYNKVFHTTPDVMLITSYEEGQVIEVNDSITMMAGFKKEEIIGKTTVKLKLWADLKTRKKYLADILEKGRVINFEANLRKKTGELFTALISGDLFDLQGEKYVLSIVHDISERKQVERSMQESEEKFRSIHEEASVGLYRTSTEGKYLSVNPSLARIFGFSSPEEMIGKVNDVGKQQYVDPKERNRFLNIIKEDGRVENYPIQVYRKDRIKIWVSVNAHPVYNPDKSINYIEGSMLDITGQKEAEEELRRSEGKYRMLVETMPDGIYRSTPEGKFVDVNPGLVSMLGYKTKDELMAVDIKKDLYFDESDRESKTLEEELEETAIYPLRKKDGSKIWVEDHGWLVLDEKGKPRYHEGILRDVTERKHFEELLRNSEELYRTLMNASPEATIMIDMYGKILEISEITPEVLNYENKNAIIGNSFLKFIPRPEIGKVREIIAETKSKGKVKNFEIQIMRSDKSSFIAEVSLTSIMESPGKTKGFVVILRDISERKNMEIQFIHNARLVSLGEMATSIAHEINQPLNIISLSLDNIFNEIKSDKPIDEAYVNAKSDKIFSNIVRIRTIIDHVRAFSRDHDDYDASLFDIHESITNAVSMVSEQLKHKAISLNLKLDKSIQPVAGNMYKFEQVVLNLLVNARDAVEERKEITLVEYHMSMEVQSYVEGKEVVVAVIDNGIGIKSNEIEKVLMPFYTTKVVGKGTGLGLAICFRIVNEMNGKIEIESKRYVGTTFRVRLPIPETTE